jgi:hypothetical protein
MQENLGKPVYLASRWPVGLRSLSRYFTAACVGFIQEAERKKAVAIDDSHGQVPLTDDEHVSTGLRVVARAAVRARDKDRSALGLGVAGESTNRHGRPRFLSRRVRPCFLRAEPSRGVFNP